MHRRFLHIFALALLGAWGVVNAEPTPLVSKLMAEPVSLFSLGMYRLGQDVSERAEKAGFSMGTVSYKWDTNEIVIDAMSFADSKVAQCATPQACETNLREGLVKFANSYAWQMPDKTWMEFVTGNFSHEGYTQKQFYSGKSLEQAVQDLGRIVKISGSVMKGGTIYQCKRELKSSDVFCSSKQSK